MSKRVEIAQHMANSSAGKIMDAAKWLGVLYALEAEGYQVVKTEETMEYNGLRVADQDDV